MKDEKSLHVHAKGGPSSTRSRKGWTIATVDACSSRAVRRCCLFAPHAMCVGGKVPTARKPVSASSRGAAWPAADNRVVMAPPCGGWLPWVILYMVATAAQDVNIRTDCQPGNLGFYGSSAVNRQNPGNGTLGAAIYPPVSYIYIYMCICMF